MNDQMLIIEYVPFFLSSFSFPNLTSCFSLAEGSTL